MGGSWIQTTPNYKIGTALLISFLGIAQFGVMFNLPSLWCLPFLSEYFKKTFRWKWKPSRDITKVQGHCALFFHGIFKFSIAPICHEIRWPITSLPIIFFSVRETEAWSSVIQSQDHGGGGQSVERVLTWSFVCTCYWAYRCWPGDYIGCHRL